MLFFLDPVSQFSASYEDLIADISGQASTHGKATANYLFVVDLLRRILRHDSEIELRGLAMAAQGDSQSEHPQLLSGPDLFQQETSLRGIVETGTEQIDVWRRRILESPSRILLETSGSTGQPQSIWHTIGSLTRGIRFDEEQRRSIWGLAYPLDHLAGLQVLFQSLLNFNPLIQLYRVESAVIHQAIDDHQISHLSCTPTFLRMLLAGTAVHPGLLRLTNGGERYDSGLDNRIRVMFPNASRRNIYASTEVGPLLVSDSDYFRVPDPLLSSVKIIDGELWLHQNLRVDVGIAPRERLFANDNEPGASLHPDFFPTGDQVEIINERPLTIRFLSRKTEGFNVAGFRVDPVRLESIARQHPKITNARFYGVPNSLTEHLVACDLVLGTDADSIKDRSWDENEFRNWFAQRVQRHEIPRMIKVVSELATTDSGKVKRL